MRRWFSGSFQNFSLCYTIMNFLFASLKLLTNAGNIYLNHPQNSLLWENAPNLLVTGALGMILQDHWRLPVCIFRVKISSFGRKRVTDRIFKIWQIISKEQAKS
jgi:hypothetical protein